MAHEEARYAADGELQNLAIVIIDARATEIGEMQVLLAH